LKPYAFRKPLLCEAVPEEAVATPEVIAAAPVSAVAVEAEAVEAEAVTETFSAALSRALALNGTQFMNGTHAGDAIRAARVIMARVFAGVGNHGEGDLANDSIRDPARMVKAENSASSGLPARNVMVAVKARITIEPVMNDRNLLFSAEIMGHMVANAQGSAQNSLCIALQARIAGEVIIRVMIVNVSFLEAEAFMHHGTRVSPVSRKWMRIMNPMPIERSWKGRRTAFSG
jgi:hypothetical protein